MRFAQFWQVVQILEDGHEDWVDKDLEREERGLREGIILYSPGDNEDGHEGPQSG
jgi:hypothetical protein